MRLKKSKTGIGQAGWRWIRTACVLLGVCLLAGRAEAQPKELRAQIEAVKKNPAYRYGLGEGPTFEAAYRMAMENLMRGINVFVASVTERNVQTVTEEEKTFRNEQMFRNLSTYSMGTLQNVQRMDYGEEPEAKVFVYVADEDVKRMFEDRMAKIESLRNFGRKEEESMRVADALRYYTWALCLLQTHPEGDTACFDDGGEKQPAKLWLHARINALLADTKMEVTDVEAVEEPGVKNRVNLRLSYKGQLVDNFAFSFHNGQRYIGPVFVSDGRAVADMSSEMLPEELKVRVEYLFRNQANTLDPEMAQVMENIDLPKFPSATKMVRLTAEEPKRKKVRKAEKNRLAEAEPSMKLADLEKNRVELQTVEDSVPYIETMHRIEQAIRQRNYQAVRDCFTPEGYGMFDGLVHNGEAVLLSRETDFELIRYGNRVVCRKLPVQFRFRNNQQFVNDVVFRFDARTGKVESLALALTRRSENDILTADKKWKGNWRMDLISFLEDYQTAYALKRIDYLESVFSDDALIVTGVVLKRKVTPENPNYGIPEAAGEVKYTRYSKQEFIERLRHSFNSKEYINLRMNETEVVKGTGTRDGIFAMQIAQDYYSNNYGDKGFLTLLVDLREELPVIKVRVWQQQKDENFTARTLLKY